MEPSQDRAGTATPSITILTATLNAAALVAGLANSLSSQTDPDFKWLVVDGGSGDGTVELLEQLSMPQLRVVQTRDFGIYDALNQGLREVTTSHYLVCGADDRLEPHAVQMYRQAAGGSGPAVDFVAAPVRVRGRVLRPKRRRGLLVHSGLGGGVAVSHAVGLLIRTDLHRRFGDYSRRLPIAADQLFFELALKGGASITYAPQVAGTYATGGVSGQDGLGTILEQYRIQIAIGRSGLLETLLMFVRITKHLVLRRG